MKRIVLTTLLLLFSSRGFSEGFILLSDKENYPKFSQQAIKAAIEDILKDGKAISKLYVEAECSEEFCDLTILTKEHVESMGDIRGCFSFCVHYGFSNKLGVIVKKAYMR